MTEHVPSAIQMQVRRLDRDLAMPTYAHAGDAGLDIRSAVDVVIAPGERALVPTGIAIAVPEGHAGFVLPRSGSALNRGLGLANAPGLIDSAYRGELKVIVINLDRIEPIVIARGEKVAQLVIQRIEHCVLVEVDQLDDTARGEGGFGSTGI